MTLSWRGLIDFSAGKDAPKIRLSFLFSLSALLVSAPQILQQPPQQQFSQSVPYNGNAEHNFVNPNNNNGMNNGGGGEHKPSTTILHHTTTVKVPSVKTDRDAREDALNQQILQNVNQSWQTLASANPTSSTVDYSSHILSATLPISIQHFLKYSETIKKETGVTPPNGTANGSPTTTNAALVNGDGSVNGGAAEVPTTTSTGKKKKKKSQKAPKVRAVREKKPRPKPGEIRETKALDGSTLFCCPECQMAYPDRSLIEQHVISHAVERRFVCDVCNAALKRKDHLTRHKLSHIPDRPHVCNVRVGGWEDRWSGPVVTNYENDSLCVLLCLDLHEVLQAEGATDAAHRHSLGRKEAHLPGVRQR